MTTATMDRLLLYLHLEQYLRDLKNHLGEEELWQMLELAILEISKNETSPTFNVRHTTVRVRDSV